MLGYSNRTHGGDYVAERKNVNLFFLIHFVISNGSIAWEQLEIVSAFFRWKNSNNCDLIKQNESKLALDQNEVHIMSVKHDQLYETLNLTSI